MLSALLDQEPFSVLLNYARQALAFLPQEEAPDPRLRMYRSTCRLFVGIDKLRQGQVGEARQLLLQAQTDNVPPGNRYLATDIRLELGKSHLIRGELQQARRYLQQTLVDSRDLDDDGMTADALLELAWLAFEWNDLKGAEQQAREALEVAQRVHPQRPELYDRGELQLALLQHMQGETHAALEQLTALLADPPGEWTPSSLWLPARLRDWQGRLLIATGDLQVVHKSLEAQSHSIGTCITEYLGEEILRGRLLLAQGEIKAALRQFTRLLLTAQEHQHQYAALEIQLLSALAHAAYQQEQQSHYWLRQTLLQAVHEGYIRLFLNEGKPMLALLRSLLPSLQHDATLRSYAQTILRAATQRTGAPHISRLVSDGPPFEPLSTQEQRVLRLLVVGRNNQEIARELIISVNTVKYHLKHLYQKLGVSNRLQASEAARRLKLDESVQAF